VIQPPATVIAFRDYYGNAVHDFGVPYLHERLVIEATSDVVTHASEDEPIGGASFSLLSYLIRSNIYTKTVVCIP